MVVAVVVVVVAAAVMAVEEVLSCGHFPQLLQIRWMYYYGGP